MLSSEANQELSTQIRELSEACLRYQRIEAWLTAPLSAWEDLQFILLDMQRQCAVSLMGMDPHGSGEIGRSQGRAHALNDVLTIRQILASRREACESRIAELKSGGE